MNNLSIALKIADFEFDHSYIEDLFGLRATDSHTKGEEFYAGPLSKRIRKEYENNLWEYRIRVASNSVWVQTIIDQFAKEIILDHISAFEKIKGQCYLELYIKIDYFNNDKIEFESLHFDSTLLQLFANYGIEIDIDQYITSEGKTY